MPELVTIPKSYFELLFEYQKPVIRLWTNRADLVESLFDSLSAYGVTIDDIEVLDSGKNSEKGIKYRVPSRKAAFYVGATTCKFTQDDASWNSIEDTMQLIAAGINAVHAISPVEVAKQKVTLAVHLQLKSGNFADLLRPFAASQLSAVDARPVRTMASISKWDDLKIYLDGSGVVANAIFLQIDREFNGRAEFTDMAKQLQADESKMFEIIGVEEDLT